MAIHVSKDIRPFMRDKITTAARSFHYESFSKTTSSGQDRYFPPNLTLMALSYLLGENHLVVGDPGWGKTTSVKVLSSLMTGTPYDLLDAIEIRGNPQKYEEKMIARPDYSKLSAQEKVIWLAALASQVLIVDEVNRLSPDAQDVLLQGIETGSWTYLNSHKLVRVPGFMTANYKDDGNGAIIAPLLDRFAVMTVGQPDLLTKPFLEAKANREKLLCNEGIRKASLDILDAEGFEAFYAHIRKPGNLLKTVSPITDEQRAQFMDGIARMELSYDDELLNEGVNDPALFFLSFKAELNYSVSYGSKRSSDPISTDAHDLTYVGRHTQNSFSPRSETAELYAKGLAYLMGDDHVTIEHLKFVLPHIIAHKFVYSDDFSSKHAQDVRTQSEQIHLSSKLVEEAFSNYSRAVPAIKGLISDIQTYYGEDSYAQDDKLFMKVASVPATQGAAKLKAALVAKKEELKEEFPADQLAKVTNMGSGEVEFSSDQNPYVARRMGDALAVFMVKDPAKYDHPVCKAFIRDTVDGLRPAFGQETDLSKVEGGQQKL